MLMLKIRLFASPQISWGETPLAVPSVKAQALLYYLATTRQPHSREKLAGLFWGEVPERQAKASLRNTLYELRRAISASPDEAHPAQPFEVVEADGNTLSFRSDPAFWLDVSEFENTLAKAEKLLPTDPMQATEMLHQGVDLYRGDFLEGFSLKDSYEFDDWSFFERDRFQRAYMKALRELSGLHSHERQYEEAISLALRILSIDMLQEDVHRYLMRLYYEAGNRGAALRQYEICRDILKREMNTIPLEETSELYQRILEQDPSVSGNKSGYTDPLRRSDSQSPDLRTVIGREAQALPSFTHNRAWFESIFPTRHPSWTAAWVGRDREASQVQKYLADAQQGKGRLVVVEGEVGIGKTRLVQNLFDSLADEAIFLAGRCFDNSTAPYQPIIETLRSALPLISSQTLAIPGIWLQEVSRLLPELAEILPNLPQRISLDAEQERNRLFEGITQFLLSLTNTGVTGGGRRLLVLFIDDLHWADIPTLQFLQYLARNFAQNPVLILTTLRSEETTEEISSLFRTLSREGRIGRIPLRRLQLSEVVSLIRTMSGMASGCEKFGARIYKETEGNPFFVIEVIHSLFETGILQQDEQGWTTDLHSFADDYAGLPIPDNVRDVIEARLVRLDEFSRQALEVMSVLRQKFGFALVATNLSWDEDQSLLAFENLLQANLIQEADVDLRGATYSFTHDKIREVAYQRLSMPRRQRLHRRVAEVLEQDTADGYADIEQVVGALAYHFARGGDRIKGLAYAIRAGHRARELYAHEAALDNYRLALELSGISTSRTTTGRSPAESNLEPANIAEIHEGMGDAYSATGRYEAAIASYQEVLNLWRRTATDEERKAEIHRKIARVYEHMGAYERSLEHLELGKAGLVSQGCSLALIRLNDGIAFAYLRQGRYQIAIEICQQSLRLLDTELRDILTQRERGWVHNTLGSAYLYLNILNRAQEEFEKSLALRTALNDLVGLATTYNNLGVVAYYRGLYDQAFDYYQQSLKFKQEIGDVYSLALAWMNLGLMHHHRGNQETALKLLQDAINTAQETEAEGLLPEAFRVQAQVYLSLGQSDAALKAATDSVTIARHLENALYIGVAQRALGQVYATGKHNRSEAEKHFQASYATFERLGQQHELAKTAVSYGRALLAWGEVREGQRLLAEAAAIFERSGAAGRLAAIRQDLERAS